MVRHDSMTRFAVLAAVAAVAIAGCANDASMARTTAAMPGGPTPWFTVVDNAFVAEPGTRDPDQTLGTLERNDDGTASFHVNGGRWPVHFSLDEADAAWIIEGCS